MVIFHKAMNQALQFTVPLTPPSANHTYLPVMYTGRDGFPHRGRKLSKEAKAYREAVAIFAKGQQMIDAPAYHVKALVFLGKGQRLDAGNAEKNIGDGLQAARVFQNDSRVKHYEIFVDRDWANPRTEISITVMIQPKKKKEKPSGKVSNPGLREGIQGQQRPCLTHGNGAPPNSGWRAVAGGQYRRAQGQD